MASQLQNGHSKEEDSSSSSDEEVNDRRHSNIDNRRTALLKRLISEGTRKEYPSKDVMHDERTYKDFKDKFRVDVEACLEHKNNAEHKTLLHYLVLHPDYGKKLRKAPFTLLTKLILEIDAERKDPANSILCVQSTEQHDSNTCLHIALVKGRVKFVKYICEVANRQILDRAISVANDLGETVLHLAITHSRSPDLDLIKTLAERAEVNTFVKQRHQTSNDGREGGNTPLHDFVKFQTSELDVDRRCEVPEPQCPNCKDDRSKANQDVATYMEILKIMVERGPKAVTCLNRESESPYTFHTATRATATNEDPAWSKLEFLEAPTAEGVRQDMSRKEVDKPSDLQEKRKEAWTLPKRKGTGLEQNLPKPEDRTSMGTQDQKAHKRRERKHSRDLSHKISRFLLDVSLSQEDFAQTCKAIFGNKINEKRDTVFQAGHLSDKTMKIREKLPLAPILASVQLEVKLEGDKLSTDPWDGKSVRQFRKERDDRVKKFFKWLRDVMHVERIVNLLVDDDSDHACSDETIERCLRGFDVRYLSWNKDDICVKSLRDEAPNLKVLEVWWCGRYSTLMGWSNVDHGLRHLKKLRELHLFVRGGIESDDRDARNINEFRCDLQRQENAPHIKLLEPEDSISSVQGMGTRLITRSGESDSLLHATRKFVNHLTRIQKEGKWQALNMKPIKVAVIDDGVNLESLSTTDIEGWNASSMPPDPRSGKTWHFSEDGHGTEMVKLICKVCPFAKFFIGKIDTRRESHGYVTESVVEAIEKAVKKRVDIICMSWTLYESDDKGNSDSLERLRKVLEVAVQDKILLYCAGQDRGDLEVSDGKAKPYPASCGIDRVKSIGAAGAFGRGAHYVNLKNVQYLFPGEITSGLGTTTGSSAATALASGFAALVLWCAEVHQALRRKDPTIQHEDMDFRAGNRMAHLFNKMKQNPGSPDASIVLFSQFFDEAQKTGSKAAETFAMKCKEKANEEFA